VPQDPQRVVKRWDDNADAIFNQSKTTTAIFVSKNEYSNLLPMVLHPQRVILISMTVGLAVKWVPIMYRLKIFQTVHDGRPILYQTPILGRKGVWAVKRASKVGVKNL
jgi:hypothetical protein